MGNFFISFHVVFFEEKVLSLSLPFSLPLSPAYVSKKNEI
jgi:hypothetical protein